MSKNNIDHKKYTNNKFVRFLFYLFLIGMLVLPVLGLFVSILS